MRNVEEEKTKKGLYKVYIDFGVSPEHLDDEREFYVSCVFYNKDNVKVPVVNGEAKNIKEAAKLVQGFAVGGEPFNRITVRESSQLDCLFSLRKDDKGAWITEERKIYLKKEKLSL